MSNLLLIAALLALAALVVVLLRRWRRHTSGVTALPAPGQIEVTEPVDEDNLDDRMIELDRLLSEGQITAAEHEQRRRQLMGSVKD